MRKKFGIPLPVLVLVMISGIAVAAAYIALHFNILMTPQTYPKVTFWNWGTLQKENTFDYSVNIFAGIKTVDENITNGIFNDDSVQHQCYICINSLSIPANIAKLKIMIYNSTNTIFTKEWTSFGTLPTAWESFTTAANAKYAIWVEITASGSLSGSSTFEIGVKENNP